MNNFLMNEKAQKTFSKRFCFYAVIMILGAFAMYQPLAKEYGGWIVIFLLIFRHNRIKEDRKVLRKVGYVIPVHVKTYRFSKNLKAWTPYLFAVSMLLITSLNDGFDHLAFIGVMLLTMLEYQMSTSFKPGSNREIQYFWKQPEYLQEEPSF